MFSELFSRDMFLNDKISQTSKSREKWLQNEFKQTVQKIKSDDYTYNEFKELIHQVQQPYKHVSSDGYEVTVTEKESVCVSKLAMDAIDRILFHKKRNDKLGKIEVLARKRKRKKIPRTPNTWCGDDGTGIMMHLEEHDKVQRKEEKAKEKKMLEKEIAKCKNTLEKFKEIQRIQKHGLTTETMTSDELSSILSVFLPNSEKESLKKSEMRNLLNSETITKFAMLSAFEKMEKKFKYMHQKQNDFNVKTMSIQEN